MQEKWTHRAVGAGVGAIVMLFALPFGAGWYTAGGAKSLASEAVTNALLPVCVEAVLANPAAVAEPTRPASHSGGHAESCLKAKSTERPPNKPLTAAT
jgi:hypothetical protein